MLLHKKVMGFWIFYPLIEKYLQTCRKINVKTDLTSNDKMFCPIACLHVLLNSSETVLGMIQYSISNFSQLKPNFLMLKQDKLYAQQDKLYKPNICYDYIITEKLK